MAKTRTYFCIDMKSFYASVECAERGYNPFETNLVVADLTRGKNALCLAITPAMKAQGIRNRCRLSEIPSNVKYEVAPPRMALYIEYAADIYSLYREFIAGYSITQIAKRLQADGVKTKLGRESWRHNVIESILTNEKYTGNALLGKTFKPDVLTKYRQKNDGKKAPIYYVEGSHPAIIEKGLFDLAQQEMQRRRDANDNKVGGGRYSSRYPFSGMLVCGICGSKLRRQVRTMGSGKRTASWGCCNRINNGRAECDSHHVNEEVLEATYLTAMRRLVDSAEEVVEVVRDGTELALEPENKAAMERIDEETIQLQEAALALHKAKQRMEIGAVEYASRVKEYSERMKELEAERNELQGTAAKYAEVRMWLDTFIEQTMQSDTLTTVDGTTMKMLVDRIHVRNDGIVVEFKCGVAIEQEYVK